MEPEPFVIEHREALIYMLCQAAELEHGLMCQYLFAAFPLKQRADEGLTPEELDAVTRWRRTIVHVATDEMLHLALVQNMLSAIGAGPSPTCIARSSKACRTSLTKFDERHLFVGPPRAQATNGFAEDMMSAYPTSKGALLQLIRSTAVEYARYGVRVNARCPGAVDTALPRKHLATAEDPDAARRRIESVTPAGRLLTPGEIANLLVFMASPLASALGGAAVVADGALTATYDFRLDG